MPSEYEDYIDVFIDGVLEGEWKLSELYDFLSSCEESKGDESLERAYDLGPYYLWERWLDIHEWPTGHTGVERDFEEAIRNYLGFLPHGAFESPEEVIPALLEGKWVVFSDFFDPNWDQGEFKIYDNEWETWDAPIGQLQGEIMNNLYLSKRLSGLYGETIWEVTEFWTHGGGNPRRVG